MWAVARCRLTSAVFLAVPLDEGANVVQLRYRPSGVAAGLIITVFSVLCFGALLGRTLVLKKRENEKKTEKEG